MTQLSDFNEWSIDLTTQEMLKDVYDVVTELELWDWMKSYNPSGGFMWTPLTKELKQINKAMKYNDHTGATYGLTMRTIRYMAIKDWRVGLPLPV